MRAIRWLLPAVFMATLFPGIHAIAGEASRGNAGVIWSAGDREPARDAPPERETPSPPPSPPPSVEPSPAPVAPAPEPVPPPEPPATSPARGNAGVLWSAGAPTPDREPPEPEPPAPPREAPSPPAVGAGAWPAGLNQYFGAELLSPSYADALAAIMDYLDRQTLRGVEPRQEAERFRQTARELRRRLPRGDAELALAEALHGNLTDYLMLEHEFAAARGDQTLRKLVDLVERQRRIDPNTDDTRAQRIADTIRGKGLFVPSSILFGRYLLPFRATALLSGHIALEIPATPTYHDEERRVQADYDFIVSPAAVFRLDFDTVGAARLEVARSNDGSNYETVQAWTSSERGGVRAPAILQRAFRSRYMRVTVDAPAEQAVLRNLRVFAMKSPAAAVCGRVAAAPVLDASFKESVWPREPQIDEFVAPVAQTFAEAQTTVRLIRTDDALYVAAYMREPRMRTMAAAHEEDDAPLWEEESFEVVLTPPGGDEFRLLVNPLGTRYDSRNGDARWNGAWDVAARSYPEGWAVEMKIPFSDLGATPRRAESWKANFARWRHNVTREWSVWGCSFDVRGRAVPGSLIFD